MIGSQSFASTILMLHRRQGQRLEGRLCFQGEEESFPVPSLSFEPGHFPQVDVRVEPER